MNGDPAPKLSSPTADFNQKSQPQTNFSPSSHHQWRCRFCGSMLGIVSGEVIFVKRGGLSLTATLPCTEQCRKCKQFNRIDPPSLNSQR